MFNIKDLVIEKIISCNVCDAEEKIIGKTTRSLDDNEPICHDYKSNDNITKIKEEKLARNFGFLACHENYTIFRTNKRI